MAAMVMSKAISRLFIKCFAAFWGVVLLTAICSIALTRFNQADHMNAPPWAKEQLEKAAAYLSKGGQFNAPQQFKRLGMPILVNEQGQASSPAPIGKEQRRFMLSHSNNDKPQLAIRDKEVIFGPVAINWQGQTQQLYLHRPIPQHKHRELRHLAVSPWLYWLSALLISLAVCFLLTRHLVKPLRELQQNADRIASGQFDAPLTPIKRSDEIGQLSVSLAQMSSTLSQAISNQRRLLSDISHELRSPLTRLNMGLALQKKRHGDTLEVQRIEREAQRLESMISALLSLSRMQINPQRSRLELKSLVNPIIDDCRFEAEQHGKTLQLNDIPKLSLLCFPHLLSSAIENLIRNAIKYASSHITLNISLNDSHLLISVSDDGTGLPHDELEQVFRPFYRLSEARDRDSGGVGLGLAICEAATRQHGGEIWAENIASGGLKVSIRLPYEATMA